MPYPRLNTTFSHFKCLGERERERERERELSTDVYYDVFTSGIQ